MTKKFISYGVKSKFFIPPNASISYGHWLVVGQRSNSKDYEYLVRCKCGLERWMKASVLVRGKSKQCLKCSALYAGECRLNHAG